MTAILKTSEEIRLERRREPQHACGKLTLAPLWPKNGENLGTLVRTADAVGACLAIPVGAEPRKAVRRGNTIGDKVCLHDVGSPLAWLRDAYATGHRLVGVEIAAGALPLADLRPSRASRTVVLLGHETLGVPQEALDLCHQVVEIPMCGVGNSLNVAVAGSLVAYRLAGLS